MNWGGGVRVNAKQARLEEGGEDTAESSPKLPELILMLYKVTDLVTMFSLFFSCAPLHFKVQSKSEGKVLKYHQKRKCCGISSLIKRSKKQKS